MSAYLFDFSGKQFTPDGSVNVPDVSEHNRAIEAEELAVWNAQPDRMLAYYQIKDPCKVYRRSAFFLFGGTVTLWTGVPIGTIIRAKVYAHNFGSRMIALTIRGTNGATYYGRASYDCGSRINLRKAKNRG